MRPTYSNLPEYPQYCILDIGDIADEFMRQWRAVIAEQHSSPQEIHIEYAYSEVYQVNEDNYFTQKIHQHASLVNKPKEWHPDVSLVLNYVIEAIKQHRDSDIELQFMEFDIASMTHYQLVTLPPDQLSNTYSNTRIRLAKLAGAFGKQVFNNLVEFGLYKNGYFPYHFAGWQGSFALVELDSTHAASS